MMRLPLLVLLACLPSATAAAAQPAHRHMIVAAEPLAAEAGLAALRAGGSAVDAAIAAQAVLAVVEPQASGVGGGAVMLHYEAGQRRVSAWDGRETAPAAAGPDLFLEPDGTPMRFREAAIGGRAVGVPGAFAMLEAAHRATAGCPGQACSPTPSGLPGTASRCPPHGRRDRRGGPAAARAAGGRRLFFHADGTPLGAGETAHQPRTCRTLGALASGGAEALTHGAIAAAIVAAVRGRRQSRPAERRRPGRLRAQAPAAGVRAVPGLDGVRHAAALLGGRDGPGDARGAGAFRPPRAAPRGRRAGPRGGAAADRGGAAAWADRAR